MTVDPLSIAASLSSGDADRVNEAIERVVSYDAKERSEWYDDLFDACQPVFKRDDGFVRQATVRLLRDAYPQLEVRADDVVDDIDGVPLEDTERQRHRLIEFLLVALEDDDGRVRAAAVSAFEMLSTGIERAGLDVEGEALHEALSALAVRQPEAKRTHTERALHSVGPPGVEEVFRDLGIRADRP